jgi:hypothetical protein
VRSALYVRASEGETLALPLASDPLKAEPLISSLPILHFASPSLGSLLPSGEPPLADGRYSIEP